MDENQKKKVQDKWSVILDKLNVDEDKKEWLSEYAEMHQAQIFQDTGTTNSFPSLLPIAKRIAAGTIALGFDYESDERIQRRKRILKLKRILSDSEFQDVVSKEEYEDIIVEKKDCHNPGLVSVQPLSAPIGMLFYMDFIYESPEEKLRKQRNEKLKRILGNDSESGISGENEEDLQ
ncbi:MAG: hypothetical protein HPY57_13480 [Ignavibacteria bacterium]|nr:hypothetical protein [Ignavibacteria bacterium]